MASEQSELAGVPEHTRLVFFLHHVSVRRERRLTALETLSSVQAWTCTFFFFFSKFPETKAQWEHKKPYQSTLPPAKILLGHSTYGTLRHSSPSQHASSIRAVAPFQMPLVHFPFVPTSRQSVRYFTTNQTRQTKPASTKELPSVLFPFSTAQTQTICKTQKGMLYYMKPNSLKRGLISGQKGYELLEMQMLHICHSRSQTKPRYNVLVVCMQFL